MIKKVFFRIHILPVMAVLLFLPLFFLLWSPAQAKKISEVKIGYILPLTGPTAQAGIQNQKACELATEYINAAGGIKSLGKARLVNVWANSRGEASFGVSCRRGTHQDRQGKHHLRGLELCGYLPHYPESRKGRHTLCGPGFCQGHYNGTRPEIHLPHCSKRQLEGPRSV